MRVPTISINGEDYITIKRKKIKALIDTPYTNKHKLFFHYITSGYLLDREQKGLKLEAYRKGVKGELAGEVNITEVISNRELMDYLENSNNKEDFLGIVKSQYRDCANINEIINYLGGLCNE